MSRKTARVAAMQMIYERIAGGEGGEDTLRMIYDELREEKRENQKNAVTVDAEDPGLDDSAFITRVLEGVLTHLDELDAVIARHSQGWNVSRMPLVDLTIIRLAAWEILFEQDVPGPVAINEAVDIASRYSNPDSGRFVNGVLGSILREKKASEA